MIGVCGLTLAATAALARPTAVFTEVIPEGPPTALVGGAVVDVETGTVIPHSTIIVDRGRITAIGPAASIQIPEGAQLVSMEGQWLIPGLMNMHVHLGLKLPGAAGAALANETDVELVLRMADNARRSLLAGVTTVRLTNEKNGTDFALKAAINRGTQLGPRIFSAGMSVVPTGGHGAIGADGPYAVARAVRQQIENGAEWIKIAISGGISDAHGSISAAPMTDAELAMVMEVARRNGVKVTAHNGSPIAAMQALKHGIDCFEHGYHLTDEVLKEMKAKGTWLVPTIVVSQKGAMEFFQRIGSPPWYLERVKSTGTDHWNMLRKAIRLGVPIALGTDQMPFEPNEGTTATVREAELYVEAGMKPIDALRAATIAPARMLGAQETIGSLAVGKYADIVALQADPTQGISALRTINFVMKSGQVVRDDKGRVAVRSH
jgi:imidazolonepropionase-like amidohydrolase